LHVYSFSYSGNVTFTGNINGSPDSITFWVDPLEHWYVTPAFDIKTGRYNFKLFNGSNVPKPTKSKR